MYRIHFDQKIGRFIIQVLVYGFSWKTVLVAKELKGEAPYPIKFDFEKHSFRTFEEAGKHISEIGLDKLYQNKSANCFHKHMNSGHTLG
jgi:hypothetical protein